MKQEDIRNHMEIINGSMVEHSEDGWYYSGMCNTIFDMVFFFYQDNEHEQGIEMMIKTKHITMMKKYM